MSTRPTEAWQGLSKWPMEHYTVYVEHGMPGSGSSRIAAPFLSYYADPFVWTYRGRPWIFAEEFRYLHNRGRIVAIPLDGPSPAGSAQVALDLPYHLSFPFLFEEQGELFMIPESWRNRAVSLFVCEDFPGRWRHVRNLLPDVDAVDSVVFQHERLWWIVTSLQYSNRPGRSLAIFFSEDFRNGAWTPHPVNNEARYSDRDQGFGRNGGSIFRHGSGLFRVMQSSSGHYGQSIAIMQIVRLTPQAFEEMPAQRDILPSRLLAKGGSHHLSICDTLIAWDVRDRVSYRQHVAFLKRHRQAASD